MVKEISGIEVKIILSRMKKNSAVGPEDTYRSTGFDEQNWFH